MLTDGISLIEGSVIVNATVETGTSFPNTPNAGELFYRTDTESLYVYNETSWVQIGLTSALLNGQPGSYYLDNANATGVMSIVHGGTGASSAATARQTLGVEIGSNVQAYDTDLDAVAALSGVGFAKRTGTGTWAIDTNSYLQKTGDTFTGTLTMTGDIIPSQNVTYSLGNSTHQWKDIWVGPGSLYINGKEVISDQSNTIVFSTSVDQNLRIQTTGTGNLELQPASTGSILVKGSMTVTTGKRILDSAGIQVEFGDDIYMNGNRVTGLPAPVNASDAATKSYIDSATTGDSTYVRTSGTQTIGGDKTFTGNTIFSGTMTLNGSSLLIADNIVEFNSDFTAGSPTEDAGFQVRRGDLGIAKFIWDETNDRFSPMDGSSALLNIYGGVITGTSLVGPLTGNASSATILQTTRTFSATGDATATAQNFNGSQNVALPLVLATVNSTVGSFGSASSVGTFTVNGKGLITTAASTAIAIDTSQVTTGTFANARIAASNVTQHQASLTILETQITDGALLARNAGNESITGAWSFTQTVTGVDPTSASHLATKQYVDNIVTGLDVKASVRTATTANITLSGTQTIDGVAVIAGDRVLVKDQTTGANNGIYVVAAGAWARSTDADASVEVTSGMYTFVSEGTTNADSGWQLTTDDPITLGTTSLTFVQFTGLGQISAGAGLTKTGSTLDVNTASSARIVVNADNIDLATVTNSGSGTFQKLATDSYGRVTGTTAVVTADITALVSSTYVDVVGDTMTGTLLTNIGGGAVSNTKHIDLVNGSGYDLFMLPRASAGGYNNLTQAGDAVIAFSAGSIDTGALVIGPWSASSKGLRIASTGIITTSGDAVIGGQNLYVNGVSNLLIQHDGSNGFIRSTNASSSLYLGAQATNTVQITSSNVAITGTETVSTSLTVGVGANGYVLLQSGDATHTGYVNFYYNGGNRQGYIGFASTNAATDTGTLNYVAGTHAFTGGLTASAGFNATGGSFTGAGTGLTGTAASLTVGNATKLATARTISVVGGTTTSTATAFDGSANITIPLTGVDATLLTGTIASGRLTGTYAISISGSAATLTTPRTINSVSFDGSANIAINLNNNLTFNNGGAGAVSGTAFSGSAATTVSYNTIGAPSTTGTNASGTWGIAITGNAATATRGTIANSLANSDGTTFLTPSSAIGASGARGTDLAPNTYSQGLFSEFKNASLYSTAGNYSGLLTFANWVGTSASTGDPQYQLNFSPTAANSTSPPVLKLRAGIDTTWGAWATVLHSSNFNTYAPTLTGTGASGTWGISISGSAAQLGGFAPSASNAANTIPLRDASGYTYFNYINSNTGNSENATISQVITTNGADNFYRKASIAFLTSSLSGTAPINISGTAAAATLAANTSSISSAVGGAYTWTGVSYFASTGAGAAGIGQAGSNARLMAYNTDASGAGDAFMAFHRPGVYAVNMGLASDNVFRLGGWSDGASVYRFQASTSAFSTIAGIYPNNGANYLRSVTGSYGGLEIIGTNGGYAGLSLSTSASGTHIMYDTAGNGGMYDTSTGWQTYYLRGNACLGIGGSTTAAGYKMYVNGAGYVAGKLDATSNTTGVSTGITIINGDMTAYRSGGTTGVIYLSNSGTKYLYYDGTNYNLNSGGLIVTGDVTAFSDIRVKTNIEVIPDALSKVLQLRGVTFNRTDTDDAERRHTGVIAQEVEAVLPEAVTTESGTDPNGEVSDMKTVAYGNMMGLMIEAIKELNAKVEALQAKLAKYED